MNFVDVVAHRTWVDGRAPCIRDDRMSLTNAGFSASVSGFAAALARRGVRPGSVLAFRLWIGSSC